MATGGGDEVDVGSSEEDQKLLDFYHSMKK